MLFPEPYLEPERSSLPRDGFVWIEGGRWVVSELYELAWFLVSMWYFGPFTCLGAFSVKSMQLPAFFIIRPQSCFIYSLSMHSISLQFRSGALIMVFAAGCFEDYLQIYYPILLFDDIENLSFLSSPLL